jgi:hypothetical protein
VGGRAIACEEGLRYGLILAVSYFFSERIASASPYQINSPEFWALLSEDLRSARNPYAWINNPCRASSLT